MAYNWAQYPIVGGEQPGEPPPPAPPPPPPGEPPPAPPPPPGIPPAGPNPPSQPGMKPDPVPGSGGTSRSDFGRAWIAYAATKPSGVTYVDWLKKFVTENPQYGATVGGSKFDKVYGPGGVFWGDAIISSGINGGTGAYWNETEGGGSSSGPGYGDYTAPFNERYKLPTLDELQHMPGYQAGLDAYRKGIETSAASKGTLLTGGTLQRLGQASTDYANQAYSNLAGLQMGEFGINRDIFYHNQDAPFSKYLSLANLGRP